jgi:hypothetical protein
MAAPTLARADVERGFVLANGQTATFAMPQFYQFVSGAWRQVPPPAQSGEDELHLHGQRVDETYYGDDGSLAVLLAGDLDSLLARACVDWGCPPELHVAVVFDASDPAAAASRPPYAALLGSLTLQLLLDHPSQYPAYQVNLASSFAGGYPTNAAATDAVRHAAGVQALVLVAQQLAPHTLQHGENAYLDVMIAREAARLGIDEPSVLTAQTANPVFRPADLWSVPLLRLSSADALPQALVMLNQWLAKRDMHDEQRLMQAFNAAPDADGWLAVGLGITRDAAGFLLAVLPQIPDYTQVLPVAFTPDFALTCPAGPYLGTLGGRAAPVFAGQWPGSLVEAWSPDGRQLTLRLAGWLGSIDLAYRGIGFYDPPSFDEGIAPVWASNNLLVYPSVRPYGTANDTTGNAGLTVLHLTGDRQFWPNDSLYVPSPDGAWAAVIGDGAGGNFALRVIPAEGGTAIFTATLGYNPAWSPDSQHLAFALSNSSAYSLTVFDLAQGAQRTVAVLHDAQIGTPAIPAGAGLGEGSLYMTWAPTGDRLAVAVMASGDSRQMVGWGGLLNPDGASLFMLPPAQGQMVPMSLAYSADGLYLATNLFDGAAQGVAIYSANGQLLRWLPGDQAGPWSPAGHTLALTGLGGVRLLAAPDAAPLKVGPAGCSGLVWRPKS